MIKLALEAAEVVRGEVPCDDQDNQANRDVLVIHSAGGGGGGGVVGAMDGPY